MCLQCFYYALVLKELCVCLCVSLFVCVSLWHLVCSFTIQFKIKTFQTRPWDIFCWTNGMSKGRLKDVKRSLRITPSHNTRFRLFHALIHCDLAIKLNILKKNRQGGIYLHTIRFQAPKMLKRSWELYKAQKIILINIRKTSFTLDR